MEIADDVDLGFQAQLELLGGFEFLLKGKRIDFPQGAQRLLAYLALKGDAYRCAVAAILWPDSPAARAAANLRSALWRGRKVDSVTVIECNGPRLRLSPGVQIDVAAARVDTNGRDACLLHDAVVDRITTALKSELLPGWSDDWLIMERQQWDQERLHRLEQLATQLLSEKKFLPALRTAISAIAIEPIREAPHRTVIEVHAAEGNHASALRHYHDYRDLITRELGVEPSPKMTRLAQEISCRTYKVSP
jgi:DNA-binding SARP family transcriptional activator